jgi:hypothetical protein
MFKYQRIIFILSEIDKKLRLVFVGSGFKPDLGRPILEEAQNIAFLIKVAMKFQFRFPPDTA